MISNRMYLLGIPFVAVVDQPLLPLYNTPRRPKQMRVDRHRMKLIAFDFKVIHMSGDKIRCDYIREHGCGGDVAGSGHQGDGEGGYGQKQGPAQNVGGGATAGMFLEPKNTTYGSEECP